MEEPLSFVRDNPFVKNDGCRRLFRRNPTVQKENSAQEASVSDQLGYSVKKVMVVEKEADDHQDNISTGSSSDIEYGPGIVEKLKAKFYQLSGIASRDAKVSPHATGKRCPSVDDILSATEQPSPTWENQPTVPNALHKAYSKSVGDVYDASPEKRNFVVHRTPRIGDEDEADDLQPISVLRKKFEQNVQRRPSQNRRNSQGFTTKTTLRPKSVDFSEHDTFLRQSIPKSFTVIQSSESCSCQIPVTSCRQESVDSYRALPQMKSPTFSAQTKDSTYNTSIIDEKLHPAARKESHLRVLEVLNHREPDDEPEFVKIGRRLKRSPLHLDDMPETIELKKDIVEENSFVSPRSETSADHSVVYRSYDPNMRQAQSLTMDHDYSEETRKYIIRGNPEIPIITSNTRVIKETENPRAFEIYSPPDPQPAKYASINSDVVIMASSEVRYPSDSSPPPEEPKHRMRTDNPVIEKSSVPQSFNKSDNRSTVQEMLHRFQKNRDSRMIDFGGHSKEEFIQDTSEKAFIPALVGFRNAEDQKAHSASLYTYAVPNNKCNVISISVSPTSDEVSLCSSSTSSSMARRLSDEEDSGISPVSTSSNKISPSAVSYDVPPAVPMTPPPSSPHYATSSILNNVYDNSESNFNSITDRPSSLASQETLDERVSRKSLSTRYLESKLQKFQVLNEKPYGDDATELKTELKESSIDEDVELTYEPTISIPLGDSATELHNISEDDDSSVIMRLKNDLYEIEHGMPQRAGDGNFVRQHLLSIVMEEDIPCILEAMNEKYNFEFEDLDETTPSTSSIIYPPERRQQRRKERNVSRIRFEPTPVVYAYLDENSAMSTQEWHSGTELDYYNYQRLFDPAYEEYERKIEEQYSLTSKSLASSFVDDFLEGDVNDYTLNNELIQTSSNENSTIFV
ncbi:unnamed protein product [Auanema sp. JU1783]|nr:unnamed protein product [Auanema sp. JU1783]